VRLRLSERVRIKWPEREMPLSDAEDVRLHVLGDADDSDHLAIMGKGYLTEEEAWAAAGRWRGIVEKGFAWINLGADFGDRAPGGGFTGEGIRAMEEELGQRVIDDMPWASVFGCEPCPRFVRFGPVKGTAVKQPEGFFDAVAAAERLGLSVSERQRLAYALYSASFGQPSPDARFVMLVMAVEALIELEPRSQAARAHVDKLIADTGAADLPENEVNSMLGALKWLRDESIRSAGKRLAAGLGERRYRDEPPELFFVRCYDLRSRLVHGEVPRPSGSELDERALGLERFVSDLLSIELLGEGEV
jgi:hypothetical protein